ncbi:hypothetical protein HYH02_008148 [Chlamydomonas schloesseri]|uniref:Uncharacterized protein n=1 Tax=Chlamydomonas schloesseri TaxID=2026947 RepID=A0A836B4G0_9CHLO|nr:hypothetical protein HYH02_008148 [Chlamydomonas schloesseri]|eukprot:KAG2446994.1 hypothetical protein HYH02_008148 [Chlamydomonas schloesseri]
MLPAFSKCVLGSWGLRATPAFARPLYTAGLAERASALSSNEPAIVDYRQLLALNTRGIALPSIARGWDTATLDSELRHATATQLGSAANGKDVPTAVQRELARRHGIQLPVGACRHTAATRLATVLPPPIRHLAVLYGVLEYNGAVPPSAAAARQLLKEGAQARTHAHPLDSDLSPVALGQISDLVHRLGYVGRPPYSYGAAQLMAACLRTILADVDDEARLRPLPSMDTRQAELLRYLRSRRCPPGGHPRGGMPAVLDVDLGSRAGVSRLAAARNILQLIQNHELCASPQGEPVEALRALGLSGPVPPTTGEALSLAAELRDRCLPAAPHHLAALRAMGWYDHNHSYSHSCSRGGSSSSSSSSSGSSGTAAAAVVGGGGSGGGEAGVPEPESVAHFKAVLRVLRRADTDAATPATRGALRHLCELRRQQHGGSGGGGATAAGSAGPAVAAGMAARLSDGFAGAVSGAAAGASGQHVAGSSSSSSSSSSSCPSQLEVRVAIEELPLSEQMADRLLELGWSGPMPATHGAALALEDYLANQRSPASYGSSSSGGGGSSSGSSSNGNGGGGSSSYASSYSRTSPSPYSSVTAATASGGRVSATTYGGSSSAGPGSGQSGMAFRRTNGPGSSSGSRSSYEPLDPSSYLPYRSTPPHHPNSGDQAGSESGSGAGASGHPSAHMTALISKLGSTPEEFLTKIQIRGMFPGSVSEWYLPTMSHEEAAHVLACLVAARRLVLQRVRGAGYDEYVERWSTAEAEGDWWGMEWLWH